MKQIAVSSLLLTLGLVLLAGAPVFSRAAGEQPTPEQVRFFELKVRPVLAERCYACHGEKRQIGGLRLDSRAAVLQGGGSGAAVTPGHPEKSPLIQAVNWAGLKMPPNGKLKAEEIAALTEWVKMGAPWAGAPSGSATGSKPGRVDWTGAKQWWAFQPVRRPEPPRTGDGWARNEIDRFVSQKLQAAGLTPAPEADRVSLARRVYFDLTGLLPTPDEVDAFVKDPSPDAYERLVDRLLASPRYGERMARHWLDLVRYADSDGYRIDDYRPNAWLYRDYVIKSFNEDKPYSRFVQEQLAGDELFPGNGEALIATGYLRHWIYEYNNRDVRQHWDTILNDITDTTGDVFLGMGVQCARCHDHKFDPILQKDYYRLQAFFAPLLPRDDLVAATPEQAEAHRKATAAWEGKTADLRRQIEEIEAKYRPKAAEDAIDKFPDDIQALIRKPAAQREPLEHQLAELAYRQVTYEYERMERTIKGDDKERYLALKKQLAAFDKEKPEPLPQPLAVSDVGTKASPVYIPKKGKEPVEPGFLTVLDEKPAAVQPLPNSTGRRAALVRWLTRPENPLTSRVIVNRAWQWHFGRGLAANASDFGKLGEKPTHPELLDWLAATFVAPASPNTQHPTPNVHSGLNWSLKALHRLILTSATYRQSSTPAASNPKSKIQNPKSMDPENTLYWRGGTRRLDAEQIRDALLAVTGELSAKAGGPGSPASEPRRTIYTRVMRNTRDPLLDVFDLPQFFTSASSRDTTTTPVQSLLLFNSQSMLLRARALAGRLEKAAKTDEERIRLAYRLAYGREASADEVTAAVAFLEEQAKRINPEEAGSDAARFLYDKIPYRDGQAAVINPAGPQRRFEVPPDGRLPEGDFTVETFLLARSVYDSGAVRTVAARWDGNMKNPGWSFGVTGKGSRRKPQTLVIQLLGKKLDGSFGEEAIFADHHIQLNKPYYAAVSVRLAADGKPGKVSFYLKDLSNDDEPLLTAEVAHSITGGIKNDLPLTLGGRSGETDSYFDGLIDDVRLSSGALGVGSLLFTAEGTGRQTVGYWQFEQKPDVFHDSAGNGLNIRPSGTGKSVVDLRRAALADFCHVLLNSSEFLYVD